MQENNDITLNYSGFSFLPNLTKFEPLLKWYSKINFIHSLPVVAELLE